jgi:hypothetical protein
MPPPGEKLGRPRAGPVAGAGVTRVVAVASGLAGVTTT